MNVTLVVKFWWIMLMTHQSPADSKILSKKFTRNSSSADIEVKLFHLTISPPVLDFPDTSSASEDEGSLRRQGRIASSSPYQAHPSVEHWFNRVIQGSSTSSSASSTSSHPGGRPHHATNATSASAATVLADLMAHTQLGQCPVFKRYHSIIK